MRITRFVFVAVVLLLLPATRLFAQDAQPIQTQPRLGLTMSGSPVSGWNFNLTKNTGTTTFRTSGSAFEVGILQDLGRDGDRGVSFVRKDMNGASLLGVEVHQFITFVKMDKVQLGVTPHVGIGSWGGTLSPTGGADATIALRTTSSVKVKFGAGLDYPRLGAVTLGASYSF